MGINFIKKFLAKLSHLNCLKIEICLLTPPTKPLSTPPLALSEKSHRHDRWRSWCRAEYTARDTWELRTRTHPVPVARVGHDPELHSGLSPPPRQRPPPRSAHPLTASCLISGCGAGSERRRGVHLVFSPSASAHNNSPPNGAVAAVRRECQCRCRIPRRCGHRVQLKSSYRKRSIVLVHVWSWSGRTLLLTISA